MSARVLRSTTNPHFYRMPAAYGHYFGRLPIRSDGLQRSMVVNKTTWASPTYDRERTMKLVRLIGEMKATFPMIQFLYNDPEAKKAVPFVTPKSGHDEHMHVLLVGPHSLPKGEVDTMLRMAYAL